MQADIATEFYFRALADGLLRSSCELSGGADDIEKTYQALFARRNYRQAYALVRKRIEATERALTDLPKQHAELLALLEVIESKLPTQTTTAA